MLEKRELRVNDDRLNRGLCEAPIVCHGQRDLVRSFVGERVIDGTAGFDGVVTKLPFIAHDFSISIGRAFGIEGDCIADRRLAGREGECGRRGDIGTGYRESYVSGGGETAVVL